MSLLRRAKKLHRQQGTVYVLRCGFSFAKRLVSNPRQLWRTVAYRVYRDQPRFEDLDPPRRLNLGCGTDDKNGFVGVDLNPPPYAIQHDITEPIPLDEESVERVVTEEMLEHLQPDEIVSVLDECWRVLEPGALLRIGVPDYGSPAKADKLSMGEDPEYPDHSTLTTYDELSDLITESKFENCDFRQYWSDGTFHYQPINHSKVPVRRAVDASRRNGQEQFMKACMVVDLQKDTA